MRNRRYQLFFADGETDIANVSIYDMDFDTNAIASYPTLVQSIAYFDAGTLMINTQQFFEHFLDCGIIYSDGSISYNDDTHVYPRFPMGSNGILFDLSVIVDYYNISLPTVSLSSLNGNGCEFMDGVSVNVTGRTIPYTVSRSYMSLMNTDTYTIVYDLVAADGSKVTCPESFLTLYVAPVVTP